MQIAGYPIRQIAYYTPDIDKAALAHSAAFGSGPFFTLRHIRLTRSVHRGVSHTFDHSSAYGQWGDVMVEFLTQHNDGPSACRDMYPSGGAGGLHHMSVFVEEMDGAIARFEDKGMPLAQRSTTEFGTDFAFLDATATLGHMVEIYEGSESLRGFYAMVREAAEGWDGSDPIRELG